MQCTLHPTHYTLHTTHYTLHTTRYTLQTNHYTQYQGLAIFTEVTFVDVHHAQMSTFVIEVCLWYIGFVLVFNWSLHY